MTTKLRVESRRDSTSEEWEPMDAWFDERSRKRKQRELDALNAQLGWQKYRIQSPRKWTVPPQVMEHYGLSKSPTWGPWGEKGRPES